MTDMTPADILRQASKNIDEHGWGQGTFQNNDGQVCMSGALNMAATGWASMAPCNDIETYHAWQSARNLLNAQCRGELVALGWPSDVLDDWSVIPSYNDREDRTIEDVRLVFKRALQEAEHGDV